MKTRVCWLFAVLTAGCGADFDDISQIKDLRILAITAEPAEILLPERIDVKDILARDFAKLPADYPQVKVHALVVHPAAEGREVSWRLLACSNSRPRGRNGMNMGPGRASDSIMRGPCPADAIEVGRGTAVFADKEAAIAATLLPTREAIAASYLSDPLGAVYDSLPITLQLEVVMGGASAVAVKRVIVSPRLSPEQKPNANPVLSGLLWRRTRDEKPIPLDPDQPPVVAPGEKLYFQPGTAEREPYDATVLDSATFTTRIEHVTAETLRFAFFATAGGFSPPQRDTEPSVLLDKGPDFIETTWRAPKDALPVGGRVDIWVVTRDERAGSSALRTAVIVRQ